jgi:hypothetical protein
MRNFNIRRTIEWLEASNLDSQNPFRPLRNDLDAGFSAIQVTALARFWDNKQINLGTLEDQYQRLVGGFQASCKRRLKTVAGGGPIVWHPWVTKQL